MESMQRISRVLVIIFVLVSSAQASPQLDEDYSLRRIAVGVIGLSRATVHGEAVHGAIEEWLKANARFEMIPEANQALRAAFVHFETPVFVDGKVQVEALAPVLQSLGSYGLHSVVIGSVERVSDHYDLHLALLQARTNTLVGQTTTPIEDSQLLDHFAMATRVGLTQLEKQIPFQGAVVSREGYRFVLDRGVGTFRVGEQVRTFTLESWRGSPVFEETGLLQITRVDRSLAFARLVADKRPKEVRAGNKVLMGEALEGATLQVNGERGLASLSSVETLGKRGGLGSVSLTLGPTLAQMNQSTAAGALTSTGSTMYPGGAIDGEVLITSTIFLDLGFRFSSASVTNTADAAAPSLGSSLNQWQAKLGYRFGSSRARPSLDVSFAYAKAKFGIDTAAEPFLFPTRTYSGVWGGIAARLPLADDFAMGLSAGIPLSQSVTETPVTSGDTVEGTSGLDIALKFNYLLTTQMDIELKLAMESHGAEFSGQGTRPTSLSSSSESQKAILMGVSYFF